MALSAERKQFIKDMSNAEIVHSIDATGWTDKDWWDFDRAERARRLAFCRDTADAEELFYYALTFNWDHGREELTEIIRNPACDQATALMIYWRAAPEWYRKYAADEQVAPHERENYALIREVEAKYLADGFAAPVNRFDPYCDHGERLVGTYDRFKDGFVRDLPEKMYHAVSPTTAD